MTWHCLAHGTNLCCWCLLQVSGCSLLCVRPECRAPVPGQASGRGAGDQYEGWGHQEAIQHQPCNVCALPPTGGCSPDIWFCLWAAGSLSEACHDNVKVQQESRSRTESFMFKLWLGAIYLRDHYTFSLPLFISQQSSEDAPLYPKSSEKIYRVC